MAQVHLHIPSFNAGELSPLLGARFAVEKVQSGCRRLRNFLIHVHGPAFRRPGMEYMGGNAGNGAKSRLVGFNFSTTTGFILELHPAGLQVWSNGARVPLRTPVALPYSEQECAEVQIAQVNDVSYLAHPNHAPRKLTRYADDDWRLEEIVWKWPALGDENTRPAEIATPTVTLLLEVPTQEWPELKFVGAYTLSVISPDLSSAPKKAHLQYLLSGVWTNSETLSWTTVAPTDGTGTVTNAERVRRLTYDGPAEPGSILRVTWSTGSLDLPLDIAQQESLQPVTIPAGDWQATVDCADTIPAGAKLTLQKSIGSGLWAIYKQLDLHPGEVTIFRGETLTAAKQFRFKWEGRAMAGTAKLESIVYPVSDEITIEVDAVNGNDRTMTASGALFQAGHVGSYWQITHRRDTAFAQIVAAEPTISAASSAAIRVSGKWDVYSYGTWSATLYLEKKIGATWEVLRSWSSRKDRNVIASGEEPQEIEMRLRVSAGTSEAATGAAVPRFVLEAADSRVYGLVQITAIGTLDVTGKSTEATVNILTTLHSTDATALWTEGAWSGVRGYPRTVTLHGQRLWFGGTRAEALRLWGSVVNDYVDFRRSSIDDAGVSFTPAAQQSNALQWMVSQEQDLVLGTNGDEWTLTGGTAGGPITPTSVQMQRRSAYGSQYLAPLLLGEVLVFVQRGAKKLRQVAPRSDSAVWSAADLTVLAEHVTGLGVTQIAAMNFPWSILWAVTRDGKLLGMTFEQEQNVFGWHVHETDGLVESVAVVYGASSDEVWICVNRGGQRFIERLDPLVFARAFDTPSQLMYLDAAKRFESALPTATLDGLAHLEGREVAVLGDGAELAPARVLGGVVTLEAPVSVAIVGLPFVSELQPMRMDIPMRDGTSQHRTFKVSRVGLYLHESLGGEVAGNLDARAEKLQYRRAVTPMDSALPLFTGDKETAIESGAGDGVNVVIRQRSPLPLNIGSLTIKGDVYGE